MIRAMVMVCMMLLVATETKAAATENASKIVGFAVLNAGNENASKIVGFAVLNGVIEAASKLVGFAVLCTPPGTASCPIPPSNAAIIIQGTP